jgi:hypothetical protein
MRATGVSLCVLLATAPAVAAPADADHAAAVESFRRGTQLVEAGRLQDAVDAFRDALQREPASVGARLDLADCYEKIGAPASAWREYVITSAYARKAGDAREGMARSSAAALEARLLVVKLVGPTSGALQIHVDGDPVAEEIVTRGSFAVSPGRHHVEITEPGKRPISVDLAGAGGETRALSIAFEPEPPSPVRAHIEPRLPAPSSSTQPTWGFLVGGVGIAAVGVGAAFGGLALSKRSTLETESHDPSVGSTRFYSDRSNADTLAAVSTAGFIVGGVALAGGIALVATAPSASRVGSIRLAPSVGRDGVGVLAVGAF